MKKEKYNILLDCYRDKQLNDELHHQNNKMVNKFISYSIHATNSKRDVNSESVEYMNKNDIYEVKWVNNEKR